MSTNILIDKEWGKIIKRIAEKEGISDFNLESNSGSVKGDGYLGVITTVLITDKNSKKTLNLIFKSAHSDEAIRSKVPIRNVYEREIYMYETIFPDFFRFQNEKGIRNQFSAVAKLYDTSISENSEVIIMEDLKKVGCKMWDRKIQMKSEHISLVFSVYAKWHSISLAMRHLQPHRYRKLTQNLDDIFVNMLKGNIEMLVKTPLKTATDIVEENTVARAVLHKFTTEIETFLLEDLANKDDHLVILHGDCWCNNMLFKYENVENPAKPTKVCLLDWQLSRTGSPVLDLAYFFYVSASTESLYEYKKFLKIYHNTVSENLRNFGCNPDVIFPYSLLEVHWKRYSRFGLYMATMVFKVLLSEVEEIKDLTDFAKEGEEEFTKDYTFAPRNELEYTRRMGDLAVFISENNLI